MYNLTSFLVLTLTLFSNSLLLRSSPLFSTSLTQRFFFYNLSIDIAYSLQILNLVSIQQKRTRRSIIRSNPLSCTTTSQAGAERETILWYPEGMAAWEVERYHTWSGPLMTSRKFRVWANDQARSVYFDVIFLSKISLRRHLSVE